MMLPVEPRKVVHRLSKRFNVFLHVFVLLCVAVGRLINQKKKELSEKYNFEMDWDRTCTHARTRKCTSRLYCSPQVPTGGDARADFTVLHKDLQAYRITASWNAPTELFTCHTP